MAGVNKMLKNVKPEQVLGVVGLVFLVYVLYRYSEGKNVFRLGMQQLNPAPVNSNQKVLNNNVVGASNQGTYAPFNGAANGVTNGGNAQQMNKPAANPTDLLPADSTGSWASLNPVGNSDLQNVNLLNPSQVVGINTQGSSLRNANLQLRSEPANPRMNTNSPWNVSTIEEDKFRKPLEIGA